jgi:hypothetical protein
VKTDSEYQGVGVHRNPYIAVIKESAELGGVGELKYLINSKLYSMDNVDSIEKLTRYF